MTLAEKIKYLRKKERLSQEELANKLGIASAHLSKLENGKYQPSIDLLKKLTDVFNVSADYLLSSENEPQTHIHLIDKSLAQRFEMLDSLDGKDKEVIIYLIDSILAKKRVLDVLLNDKVPA